jgi:tRNA threonylcarbamoyladenosine biosynthesis protein TsaB
MARFMIILSIATCGTNLSVALSKNKNLISYKVEYNSLCQADKLIPLVEDILRIAKLEYKDVNYLALTNGPGSFTGLRVGLAYANALKLATNIEMVTMSSLEVIMHKMSSLEVIMRKIVSQSHNFDFYIPVLGASRTELYIQTFDKNKNPVTEIKLLELNGFMKYLNDIHGKIAIGGGGLLKVIDFIEDYKNPNLFFLPRFPYVEAATICRRAYEIITQQKYNSNLTPIYVRKPDAKIGKNSKLL